MFVRLIGLEPTRRETPDPKSGASTNFATGAFLPLCHTHFCTRLVIMLVILRLQSYTLFAETPKIFVTFNH